MTIKKYQIWIDNDRYVSCLESVSLSPLLQPETVRTSLEPIHAFLKRNQSCFPSIQSSTSPPHQSLGLSGMIMQYAISTSIFDTGAISSPKHLQHVCIILLLHDYNAAKIPKGACNTAGSPSRSCLRKSPQLSRGLEPYKWNSSKCSLYAIRLCGMAMYKR